MTATYVTAPALADARPDSAAAGGTLVWRTWLVAPDRSGSPMLTGLFGFPWRSAVLEAKCLLTDAPPADLWGTPRRIDRHHRSVPAPRCSCGVYGVRRPEHAEERRPLAPGRPVAFGFVELGGRILDEGDVLRAERGRIVGPLMVLPGLAPLAARLRMAAGAHLAPAAASAMPDGYRVRWRSQWDGGWERWRDDVAARLAVRYGVEVLRSHR